MTHRCRYFSCRGSPVESAMLVRKLRYWKVAPCCISSASGSAASTGTPLDDEAAAALRTLSLNAWESRKKSLHYWQSKKDTDVQTKRAPQIRQECFAS